MTVPKRATKKSATKVSVGSASSNPEEVATTARDVTLDASGDAPIGRDISTGKDGGFLVLLGDLSAEESAPSEPTVVGRDVPTGSEGGFLVFLGDDLPNPPGGAELEVRAERILDLGTIATICNVADLHTRALLLMARTEPIEIRAGEIERVDTAALQLLCAFCSDAVAQGIELRWDQPSATFGRAVTQLGLTTEFCVGNRS